MKIDLEQLPENWKYQELNGVVISVSNGTTALQNKERKGYPITRIETIANGTIDITRVGWSDLNASIVEKFRLNQGDILFSHINSVKHLGKIAIYLSEPKVLIHGMNLLRIRSNSTIIEPKFLFYQLKSPLAKEYYIQNCNLAVNQASLNIKHVSKIPILLPPLEVQQQIVSKLDAFFKEYNEAKKQLELEKARTEKIMQATIDKLIPNLENGMAPEGWQIQKLSNACIINPSKKELNGITDETLVSFVPMAAVSEKTQEITVQKTEPFAEVKNGYTYFRDGDVIFAKITPCMENGKVAVAKGLKNGVGFGSTEFHVLRAREGLDSRFIFYLVWNPSFREEAKRHMAGTSGHLRVPMEFIENKEVSIPSLSVQQDILAKLDVTNQNLSLIKLELERKERVLELLPNAVLKKAFSGELS